MLDAYIIDWRKREEERRREQIDDRQPRTEVYVPVDPWAEQRREYERSKLPPDRGVIIVDLNLRPAYQSNLEGRL
ncbi:hypothetical protein HZC31_05820 [Candidatus Woesearchaeota archaeon]|nr:hypothetical protein [Candidatus Woesearchaeota archaeon]